MQRSQVEIPVERQFHSDDGLRLKHVIWDLILERVLVPGTSDANSSSDSGWPFLSLTDHGKKVVAEEKPVPYDPDGYLTRLESSTGGLGDAVREYVAESIATFRTGNNLSSAVMLGAASEMAFLELCEAIANSIQNPTQASSFRDKTGPSHKVAMSARVKTTADWLSQKQAQLSSDWQAAEGRELIQKIADIVRYRRNEAGHPTSPPKRLSHEEMYALLMVFPYYCEKLYVLKTWLEGKKSCIV